MLRQPKKNLGKLKSLNDSLKHEVKTMQNKKSEIEQLASLTQKAWAKFLDKSKNDREGEKELRAWSHHSISNYDDEEP